MRLETFFEKFDEFADGPDALSKLRELLLELAVRGALSERLSADINEEVWREFIGSVDQRTSESSMCREAPFEIPGIWRWVCLDDLGTSKVRNDAEDDSRASFVPMAAVSSTYGVAAQSEERTWGEIKRGFTHFGDGDVVMAKITPCFENAKSAVMRNLVNGIGAGTTELHVFRRATPVVLPEFVLLYVKTRGYISRGEPRMTGSAGQKRVPREYFSKSPFPLPPPAEQKRIVAKVDELMALCDRLALQQQERETCHAALAHASLARFTEAPNPANLSFLFHPSYTISPADLRKSILTLAVQGKLVLQGPTDDSEIVNLDQVEWEKVALIEARKLRPNRVTEIFQTKALRYPVPGSWRWFRLGDVAFFQEGPGIRNWQFRTQGIKLLNVQNIVDGKLVLNNTDRHISIEEFESTYRHFAVEVGDILFASSGASWGKTAWFEDPGYTVMLNTSMVRLKFYSKRCDDAFLLLFLRTEFFRTQMEIQLVGIQPNFGSTHLGRVYIPIPPLAEQRRIVAKVDQLMALVDQLEAQLTASRATATRLLDAIVAELTAA